MNIARIWEAASKGAASCFFLSYLMGKIRFGRLGWTGAGLIGTLFGALTAGFLPVHPLNAILATFGAILLAVVISDIAEEAMGRRDDPRIVIDEWVGYWCAVAALPFSVPLAAAAFVLFRIFDVLKPWPIRPFCQWPGGWGVVLDDVVAGLLVNGILRLYFVLR